MNYRYIDTDAWKRKKQYLQFSSYLDPCYCTGVRLDVTYFIGKCKEKKISFFPSFTYVLMTVLNRFDGFKLRLDADKRVLLYDQISPSYVVAMHDNGYEIACSDYREDFSDFYRLIKNDIADTKNGKNADTLFNEDGRTDLVYLSTLPWGDIQTFRHPLPLGNPESLSIPRIIWGQYVLENGKYNMFLSVTANHALVDGYELSMMLCELQKELNSFNPEGII